MKRESERERCRVSASSFDDRGGRIRWKRRTKKTNVASVPKTGKRVGKNDCAKRRRSKDLEDYSRKERHGKDIREDHQHQEDSMEKEAARFSLSLIQKWCSIFSLSLNVLFRDISWCLTFSLSTLILYSVLEGYFSSPSLFMKIHVVL